MIKRFDDFIKEIDKISEEILKDENFTYDENEFEESFFRQSSHTPDNIKSIKNIEYGSVRLPIIDNRRNWGLKVKGKDVLLSDVLYYLESSDEVINILKEKYKELTITEIKSLLRVMVIVLSGLQCEEFGD